MKQIKIKVSGSGTKEEIVAALRVLADSIDNTTEEEHLSGQDFEDNILMAETDEA